jgi:hypothetical protein
MVLGRMSPQKGRMSPSRFEEEDNDYMMYVDIRPPAVPEPAVDSRILPGIFVGGIQGGAAPTTPVSVTAPLTGRLHHENKMIRESLSASKAPPTPKASHTPCL